MHLLRTSEIPLTELNKLIPASAALEETPSRDSSPASPSGF